MKWLGVAKKKRLIHNYSDNKKSRIRKWLYRLLFLLLLLLFLLMFNHFELALETLSRVNADQMNIINNLAHKVHGLELSNANLHIQSEMMKVKINGINLELHNQAMPIHNVTQHIEPQTHTVTHNDSSVIHNGKSLIPSIPIVTTAAMAVFTLLKGVATFVPAFP